MHSSIWAPLTCSIAACMRLRVSRSSSTATATSISIPNIAKVRECGSQAFQISLSRSMVSLVRVFHVATNSARRKFSGRLTRSGTATRLPESGYSAYTRQPRNQVLDSFHHPRAICHRTADRSQPGDVRVLLFRSGFARGERSVARWGKDRVSHRKGGWKDRR